MAESDDTHLPEDDPDCFGHDRREPGGELDWPGGDDDELGDDPARERTTGLPPKLEAWRRRSAAGAILTGFALGLQEALETKRQEPSIMIQTSGDPPKDLPVEADFEYGRPRQSVVQIRPWLLEPKGGDASPAAEPAGDDDSRPGAGATPGPAS